MTDLCTPGCAGEEKRIKKENGHDDDGCTLVECSVPIRKSHSWLSNDVKDTAKRIKAP